MIWPRAEFSPIFERPPLRPAGGAVGVILRAARSAGAADLGS
jgi:hypothetical protein